MCRHLLRPPALLHLIVRLTVQESCQQRAFDAAYDAFHRASVHRPSSGSSSAEDRQPFGRSFWTFKLHRRLCRGLRAAGGLPSQGYGAVGLYRCEQRQGQLAAVSTWAAPGSRPGLELQYVRDGLGAAVLGVPWSCVQGLFCCRVCVP